MTAHRSIRRGRRAGGRPTRLVRTASFGVLAGAAGTAAKDRMGSVICIKQMTRSKGRMRASRLLNLEFINLLLQVPQRLKAGSEARLLMLR